MVKGSNYEVVAKNIVRYRQVAVGCGEIRLRDVNLVNTGERIILSEG